MKKLNGFGNLMLTMIVLWSVWLGVVWVRTVVEIGTQPGPQDMAILAAALAMFSLWVVPVGIGMILLALLGRKRPTTVVILKDATVPHTSYEVKGKEVRIT